MVAIYIDDSLVYYTLFEDEALLALDVKLTLDIEDSGSLSFVLPPGNAQYDAIRKMKSIVTVYQDDVMLFRGRVTECERDFYNQKSVYCEGDRSFLNDSLWEEQTVTGKVLNFFRSLIDNHNAQVDEEKRFTVGVVTAVDADTPIEGFQRIETRRHWDTATILDDRLLSVYGGYIRTRTEGGTTYIDWIKEFEEESTQPIAFSVNLLDLTDKMDASDVFTCLIPLGYSEIGDDGTYEDPVDITSVNNGIKYIENAEAVKKYGRIWRSKTWANTKDPAKLLEKGREYLKTGVELRTLEIKAVDMHLTSGQIEMIRIGTKVQIESDPHGISLKMVCAKLEPDIENPENTTYTFGVKPRTLTEAVIRNEKETCSLTGKGRGGGGGGKSVEEELQEIFRWAKISVDEANANIYLNAGEINQLTGRMSQAEIDIDGVSAQILLKASQKTVDELTSRVSSAEIAIDGANAAINLKASQETVDTLTGRVSTAEATLTVQAGQISSKVSKDGVISEINQSAESVVIKASKINLSGYVTASQLEAEIANIKITDSSYITTAGLSTQSMDANYVDTNTLAVGGTQAKWKEITVVTDTSLSKSYTTVPGGNGMDYVVIGGVTLSEDKETIYYLGH